MASQPARGSIWRTVIAVLWSFVGLRKGSEYQEDIRRLNPIHIIVVGLPLGIAFVVGLMMLARFVVAQH